jgi:rhodanese-related sulfurtransferase
MENGMSAATRTVGAAALRRRLNEGGEIALIDAREEGSFYESHLLMASCLPLSRLELLAAAMLPRKGVAVVVMDNGEGQALRAARRLAEGGWRDVAVLDGGIKAWGAAGFPLYSGVHVPSKAFAEVVEHECGTPWISAEDLAERQRRGEDLKIFDSRSFEEYHSNSIPGAVSVPGAELVYRFADLVPSSETFVVVNCGGRTRSIIGAQALIDAGVPNRVLSLKNGTMAWHLAGLGVVNGATARAPEVSEAGLGLARRRADKVARRYGVSTIDRGILAQWQNEAEERTLYVLDVRDPAEYRKGHLRGSLSAPGGQLVQETDNWLAVWGARVVLVDDTGVRARMTASWLRRMGWDAVVLDHASVRRRLEEGMPPPDYSMFPLAGPEPGLIEPRALDPKSAIVVDLALSKRHRAGHVPGARCDPIPARRRARETAGGRRHRADERRRRARTLRRRRGRPQGPGAEGRDASLAARRAAARRGHGHAALAARRRGAVGARAAGGRARAADARVPRLGGRPRQPDRPRQRLPVSPDARLISSAAAGNPAPRADKPAAEAAAD